MSGSAQTRPEDLAEKARAAAEQAARASYGRLLAFLVARTRDVAGAGDEEGEEPPVGGARRLFGRRARLLGEVFRPRLRGPAHRCGGGRTGRTSVEPPEEAGLRAAQAIASSRPGTSMTK